jgi:hypothetical protein
MALRPAMTPGPSRNVQSCTATSERLMVVSVPGSAAPGSWRRVTIARTATMPTKIVAASRVRVATKPMAAFGSTRRVTR